MSGSFIGEVAHSATIQVRSALTAGDLARFAGNVPPDSRITVATHAGDRNEMPTHSITATWKEGPNG